MKISSTQLYNANHTSYGNSSALKNKKNPQFTGAQYDKFTDLIAQNYYKRFYKSNLAKNFVNWTKGKKFDNMTTHMSALGSTLISGMYIARTLENDKLDPQKRKTLALNDFMVWGISTLCAYFLDSKLAHWWNNVTTRFTAVYIQKHPEIKKENILGSWNAAELRKKMKEKKCDNVRDFNLDYLKNKNLTTYIDGMSVLKSLFVFGMVYRYVVPVLVMKPANMIGNYYHKKQEEKAQAAQANK